MQNTLQKIKLRLPSKTPSEEEMLLMKNFLKDEGVSFYEDLKNDNDKMAEIAKRKKGKEKRLQKKIEKVRAKKYD